MATREHEPAADEAGPSDTVASRSARPTGSGRILIWGAGGHAKVVADLARACGYRVVGHVDLDKTRIGELAEPGGARILFDEGSFQEHLRSQDREFDALAIGIGKNEIRRAAVHAYKNVIPIPVLVHPSATLSPSCRLGLGSVVMANVVVNAAARIGEAAILNTACVIEHDCALGDGVHVSPSATLAGGVHVGNLTWIGAGATVIETVRIGERVIVGAGSVVVAEVRAGLTVVGCPAKPLRRSDP